MRIRATVSTTSHTRGRVYDLPEKEARRLIEIGRAECVADSAQGEGVATLSERVDALSNEVNERMDAFEKRLSELETRPVSVPNVETAAVRAPENTAKQTEPKKPRARKGEGK